MNKIFSKQFINSNKSIFLILTVGFILRIYNSNQSFWLDEAAQALESIRPFSQQWDIPNDFQPPLFHYWVHFFAYFSTAEWWLRLASIIPGVATVYGVFLIVKKIANQQAALLAAVFMATAPYHIYYSQELRPYALSAFWATFSIYFLITQRWWWYIISIIGGLYSLYLFPFLIITQAIWVWFTSPKSRGRLLRSLLIAGIAFLPWLPHLWRQLQGGSQLPEIWPQWRQLSSVAFWKVIPLTYAKFVLGRISFDNNLLYGLLVLITIPFVALPIANLTFTFGSRFMPKTKKTAIFELISKFASTITGLLDSKVFNTSLLLIMSWLAGPFLIAILVSVWIPLNGPWRLLFILPAFYILMALGIYKLTNSNLRKFFLIGLITINLFGIFLYHSQPRFHREDWRGAVNFLQQQIILQPNTLVINAFPEPFAPVEWYAPAEFPAYGVLDALIADQAAINDNLSLLTQNVQTVYRFEYLEGLTDSQHLIDRWLIEHDFTITKTFNFNGVGFIHEYQRYGAFASL